LEGVNLSEKEGSTGNTKEGRGPPHGTTDGPFPHLLPPYMDPRERGGLSQPLWVLPPRFFGLRAAGGRRGPGGGEWPRHFGRGKNTPL